MYRSFNTHSAQAADQLSCNQYLGASHLSGIPFSFPIILLSEISQPDYVQVSTCNNVQIMHPNANIDECGILSDPLQCMPEMAFIKVIFLFQKTYLGLLYE